MYWLIPFHVHHWNSGNTRNKENFWFIYIFFDYIYPGISGISGIGEFVLFDCEQLRNNGNKENLSNLGYLEHHRNIGNTRNKENLSGQVCAHANTKQGHPSESAPYKLGVGSNILLGLTKARLKLSQS